MSEGSSFTDIVDRDRDAPCGGAGRDAAAPGKIRLQLRYVLVVWGEAYIDRYFESAFPTHLSPNNLPALARDHDLSFAVLTRAQDQEIFKGHAQYDRLRRLGKVEAEMQTLQRRSGGRKD